MSNKIEHENELRIKKDTELQELDIVEQQLLRQLSGAKDKLGRLEQHQNTKKDAWDVKMSQLKAQYDAVLLQRQKALDEAGEKDSRVTDVEMKVLPVNAAAKD
jgi:Designed helical repeat protein 10 domain